MSRIPDTPETRQWRIDVQTAIDAEAKQLTDDETDFQTVQASIRLGIKLPDVITKPPRVP